MKRIGGRAMRVKIPAGLFRGNAADRWTDRKIWDEEGYLMIQYYGRWFEVRRPSNQLAGRWPTHWVAVPSGTPPEAIIE